MSIGKTIFAVSAVAITAGVVLYLYRRARTVNAARQKAGFSADSTAAAQPAVKLSIDVDTGEPVLSTR